MSKSILPLNPAPKLFEVIKSIFQGLKVYFLCEKQNLYYTRSCFFLMVFEALRTEYF